MGARSVMRDGALSRRRLLGLALLVPAGAAAGGGSLSACTVGTPRSGPDPLTALAEKARSDAALAAAVLAAAPDLADRVEPVRAARAEHAAALDAEIARLGPSRAPGVPGATASPRAATAPTPATLKDALDGSAREAQDLVGGLPARRVGLVGSVAACCTAYASMLAAP